MHNCQGGQRGILSASNEDTYESPQLRELELQFASLTGFWRTQRRGVGGGGEAERRAVRCMRMRRTLMALVERYVRKELGLLHGGGVLRLVPDDYIYIFLGECAHIWF